MAEIIHKLYHDLGKIPNNKYTGYIWKSDEASPTIYNDDIVDFSEFIDINKPNPFIIEGNFFAEEQNVSVSIKHYDGKYFISIVYWNCKPKDAIGEFTEHKYLSNPVLGTKKLMFKEFWEEEDDELCKNMKVLKPAWVAFVGFSKIGGKDD